MEVWTLAIEMVIHVGSSERREYSLINGVTRGVVIREDVAGAVASARGIEHATGLF